MSRRRVIFVPEGYWTKETPMTDFDPADCIDLTPDRIAIRYGQSEQIDAEGYVDEGFRVELTTDRGPFALNLTPAGLVELAGYLLNAFNQLDQQRATWDNRRQGRP
ncbi:hypothetical protein MycrhDRAFT_1973 [Mycolicibacterium rhodesiae JS60]|nr:hypothetical protein MycrhDRAFT_1973 [Mycolicibacterium rhodesiae JS60]